MPTDPLIAFLQQRFPQQGLPQQGLNVQGAQQLATPQLQRALSLALRQPAAVSAPENRRLLTQPQLAGLAR